jgi:hypothetical protein
MYIASSCLKQNLKTSNLHKHSSNNAVHKICIHVMTVQYRAVHIVSLTFKNRNTKTSNMHQS